MEVTIKYFAWVRERVGKSEEHVALPASVETVADTINWLKTRGEGYAAAFEHDNVIRAAIDHAHAQRSSSIKGAKELAFFPPITGG